MISVIIPNYNHAPYLKQRIDAVLSQSYQNFEIIILDDCSTDNSREVIEPYRHNPKVSQIVFNETNSGTAFKQWQKGIELAGGAWIWIAESDDWCEDNFLETLVQGMEDDTTIAIAQSVVLKDNGEILWKSETSHLAKTFSGNEFIKTRMLLDNFGIPNASMCIFRKNCYYQANKAFTTYKFCGDWLFWISIALQGSIFISGKYLNYFRKHDRDVSGGAYYSGLHFSEYFTLLNSLEAQQIIDGNEKHDLLKQKMNMFLGDERLGNEANAAIDAQFKKLLGKSYYLLMLQKKLGTQLRKLKKTFRSS